MAKQGNLTTLLEEIRRKLESQEAPVVVTVSGPSGSGKTRFIDTLRHEFPDSAVLRTDDYYIGKTRMNTEMPDGEELNFDHPDAIDIKRLIADLSQLKAGLAVSAPLYDMLVSEPLPETARVAPKPLIIVEGIIANYPAVRNLSNISVCVTAPFETRLARRMERDKTRKNHSPDETKDYMLHVVEPTYENYYATHDMSVDFVANNR